jgi:predicted nucleic acid-binding protein
MITADSSVWIGFFNGHDSPQVRALDAALDDSAREIVLLDVVLMEVLRGFRHDREQALARQALAPLPVVTAGGEALALEAAALYRRLRREGITVRGPIDLLIGAWCLHHDCLLIHDDRDFAGMEVHEGLQAWRPQ